MDITLKSNQNDEFVPRGTIIIKSIYCRLTKEYKFNYILGALEKPKIKTTLAPEEIDQNIICRSLKKVKSKDLFNDIEVNCPDLRTVISTNVYGTDALSDNCPDY